jgi:hypothetical protein
LQGAQLPPVLFEGIDGLKYYPDQPTIEDLEVPTGLSGARSDSAAIVPTRDGTWELPELRIPWWDTEARTLRVATLPARTLNVSAGAGVTNTSIPVEIPAGITPTPMSKGITIVRQDNRFWQGIAAFSAMGWLLTLAYLILSRRGSNLAALATPMQHKDSSSEKAAYKKLIAACSTSGAIHVRSALVAWASALLDDKSITTLEAIQRHFCDDELDRELHALDAALYSETGDDWNGQALATTVKRLRGKHRQAGANDSDTLELYPAG